MAEISSIAQRLLQFSPDAMLVVDEYGIIQFSNATSTDLFGYRPEQLMGQPIKLLIPERFHMRHGAHVANFLRQPASREMGARITDLFARRADGSEFPAGIRLSPFQDDGRNFVAAAIRDMTERRAISDALVAAREEAERANRAKSRFLATASHDLRQPLQAIRLINASMQKLAQQIPHIGDLAVQQETAIDSATRMLNALLDISRLESGTVEPQLSPVSLATTFQELAREFDPAAATKKLRLEFADTQIVLSTDRTLFAQLLQNLIGNALKYTEHGYVRITQGLESDALVLAIVREVCRLLGYSVAVSSRVGEGTGVSIRIPRHRLLAAAQAPVPAADVAIQMPLSGSRVVLLEDNDAVRMATELFLTLEGFDTRAAATVEEAEGMLADMRSSDILIADYHLDGKLTGLDVLLQLRSQQGRDVPAILLSGDLQSMMRVVKTAIPNCRFLSKPVDTKALLTAIAELGAS
jgi:two-component system, sensor histidine kinase